MEFPLRHPRPYSGQNDSKISSEDDFLDRIRIIIEKNLDNDQFSIDQLYRKIGVSRIQLYRKLKSLTGQSPAQVILNIRLQKARGLLQTTNQKVGEVASNTGFKDHSHFTKLYKDAFGELPSETKI